MCLNFFRLAQVYNNQTLSIDEYDLAIELKKNKKKRDTIIDNDFLFLFLALNRQNFTPFLITLLYASHFSILKFYVYLLLGRVYHKLF